MAKFFFKALLCFLLQITTSIGSSAQTTSPKLVPPSPSTAALFRFQDYPMDYSTGLPQISVPIYEVTSGSLSVPISISYHASGRKVYDQDGAVALGWSLNAGGAITRTIHGTPDFGANKFPYPFKTGNLSNINDLAYLEKIMRYQNNECETLFPFYDSEYDVFSYSFGNNNGKFIFKDDNNVKATVFLPYKPFVLTTINASSNAVTFNITDDAGTFYEFKAAEFTQLDEQATTSWNLAKIISADKTDTISFTYIGGVETRKTISQMINYQDDWHIGFSIQNPNPAFNETTSQANYQVSRISEIKFKQGKVKFNLQTNTLRIDNIQILNFNSEIIKTIQFNSSGCYFQAEIANATNQLDALEFKDKLNTVSEKYAFNYYPIINSDINGPVNVRYCDWWGYYNNSGQHDMIPYYTITALGFQTTMEIGNPFGNRQPSLEPLKSGILKKITYPTGGASEFIYESNKCLINGGIGTIVNGPGLRIYQIKSTDGNGTYNTRTFKYGNNEVGYGFLEMLPALSSISNELRYTYFPGSNWIPAIPLSQNGYYRERFFYSDINSELSELAQRPVLYQEITEYKGTETTNIGKTVYHYDYSPWSMAGLFPKNHIYNFNYWNLPTLTSQDEFKNTNMGYKKVSSSLSNYTLTPLETIKGLHVERKYVTPQDGHGSAVPPGSSNFQLVCSEQYGAFSGAGSELDAPIPLYTFSDYEIAAGYKNLTTNIKTLFTDAGNVTTNTFYTYNSKNLLSRTETTTSKGINDLISTDIKYPFDFSGIAVLDQMTSLNMLNFPVEQNQFHNYTPLKSIKTTYFNWATQVGTSNALIAPILIDAKKGSNPYETKLEYYRYDKDGNAVSFSKENDILSTYIWDYHNLYPIGEIKNAFVTYVACTSFEADGTGNWNGIVGSNITVDVNSLTGTKYYVFNGSTLSKTGLNSNDNYIVSYWSKNGQYNVSGTPISGWPKNLRTVTINGVNWVSWEHKVTNTSTISITGTGAIDELRLYPENSSMTTYTYNPLIGMTSKTDINNNTTYYDYDSYQRLKMIRDFKGNVLKTYNYQYKNN